MNTNAKILVTGATGFIGTHLVQQLWSRGFYVNALCRNDSLPVIPGIHRAHPLIHPKVNRVRGDVTDRESIDRAMIGCDYVFHMAGLAKQWEKDPAKYYRVNVDGVRNVLESAKRLQVRRTVVTSSIVTFGPTLAGQIGNESMPRNTSDYYTEYEKSKSIGEQIAMEFASDGLPVVIVNPTRVFGPGYLNEGNSVSMLIDEYDRGRLPILLNGGRNQGNYVFVDDVVEGHILAMRNGRSGQKYILGGENVSLKGFFDLVDQVSGKKHLQLSMNLTPRLLAWAHEKRARWLGIYPRITPSWLKTFMTEWVFDCEKARVELGYSPNSIRQGIETTYRWLADLRKQQKTTAKTERSPAWTNQHMRNTAN